MRIDVARVARQPVHGQFVVRFAHQSARFEDTLLGFSGAEHSWTVHTGLGLGLF
jgi:hypothetical protein